jgi:Xaa-Pro dipeptidase
MDYSILNKTSPEDIETKKDRVLNYLDSKEYDGAVIGRRDNFAWFTCGGENKVLNFSDFGFSYLLITKDKIQLISQIMDGQRVIDEEMSGFDIEYVPLKWFEDSKEDKILKLTSGKNLLSDVPLAGCKYSPKEFYSLHYPLTPLEIERLRWLGSKTERIIRNVSDSISSGMSEIEIAGMLLGEYGRSGIECEVLMIGSDERISKYRHPLPTDKKVEKFVLVHPAVKKWGLHANVTRLVSLEKVIPEIQKRYDAACRIAGEVILSCKQGTKFSSILERQKYLFENFGYKDEWEKHYHGGISGYLLADATVGMDPDLSVISNQAYDWFITITGVKVEELSINANNNIEVTSINGAWPVKEYEINSQNLKLPQILCK